MSKKPKSSEIYPGPGYRIRQGFDRPRQSLIDRYKPFETPDISDQMNRLYTMVADIKNVVNNEAIVGPACPVKVFPGDNLMIHKALDVANPGDIIAVDAGVSPTAVIGDLVAQKAKHRGIAGFVIDGMARDLPGMREVGLPIYAKGITPLGPLHRGPGEIGYPISCGGVVVNPGDIIAADESGVAVVRRDFADEIIERLEEAKDRMEAYIASVKKGDFSNAWVDDYLDESKCTIT